MSPPDPIWALSLDPVEGLPSPRPPASFVPLRNKFLATPLMLGHCVARPPIFSLYSPPPVSRIGDTRCHILKLKCTKFHFRWGSVRDPAWGAHSALPDSLAVIRGPLLKGGWGEGDRKGVMRRRWDEWEREGEMEVEFPTSFILLWPLHSAILTTPSS